MDRYKRNYCGYYWNSTFNTLLIVYPDFSMEAYWPGYGWVHSLVGNWQWLKDDLFIGEL